MRNGYGKFVVIEIDQLRARFTIAPRIVYLEENGNYKTHEPEPVTIIVKELGIKGWLKGER